MSTPVFARPAPKSILFSPQRTKPQEIYEDGKKALRDNLIKFVALRNKQGNKYGLGHVNRYNAKAARIQTLQFNEDLANSIETMVSRIEKQQAELESWTNIRKIMRELTNVKSIPRMITSHIDQLMGYPGYAILLRDRIERAANHEIQSRDAEVVRVKNIVERLDLPGKQHMIEEGEQREKQMKVTIQELKEELIANKDSYQALNTEKLQLQIKLGRRANESIEEVSELKRELESSKSATVKAEADSDRLSLEKIQTREEIDRLKRELTQQTRLVKKRDEELENERKRTQDVRDKGETWRSELQKLSESRAAYTTDVRVFNSQYEAEKSAREMRDEEIKELKILYNEKVTQLEDARKLEAVVSNLRSTKENLDGVISEQKESIAEQKKEINDLKEIDIKQLQQTCERLKNEKDELAKESDHNKHQAELAYTKLSQEHAASLATLKNELTIAKQSAETTMENTTAAAKREHDLLQEKLTESESKREASSTSNTKLRGEMTELEKRYEVLTFKDTELEIKVEKLEGDIAESQQQLRLMNDIVLKYQSGEPAAQAELDAARQETQTVRASHQKTRDLLNEARAEQKACNEVILAHALPGLGLPTLDYGEVRKVLSDHKGVTAAEVERAFSRLKPFCNGLLNHAPIKGFQLWIDTVANPGSFTSDKVIGYLTNSDGNDFGDIGFLHLAVDVVLQSSQEISDLVALGVVDALQFMLYLYPYNTSTIIEGVEELKRVHPPRDDSVMRKSVLAFAESVLDAADIHYRYSRSDTLILAIGDDPFLIDRSLFLTGDDSLEPRQGPQQDFAYLLPLDCDQASYLYIERTQAAWLQSENITVRLETSEDAWYLHDNLTPHIMRERKFKLIPNNFDSIFKKLGGVTFI